MKQLIVISFLIINLFSCAQAKSADGAGAETAAVAGLASVSGENSVPSDWGLLLNIPPGIARKSSVNSFASEWSDVSDLMTTIRSINLCLEGLLSYLYSNGQFSNSSTASSNEITLTAGKFKTLLTLNANVKFNAIPEGLPTQFNHKFEMWDKNDNKALEFYFDDANSPTSESGTLLRFRPGSFSILFLGNISLVEVRYGLFFKEMIQIVSWNGNVGSASSKFSSARVQLRWLGSGNGIGITAVGKLIDKSKCAGVENDYYAIAAQISTASPNYSTIKFGVNNNSIGDTLCSVVNSKNYGLFNADDGMNCDGAEKDSCKVTTGYPKTSDIDTLFGSISIADYMSISNIDSIKVEFSN